MTLVINSSAFANTQGGANQRKIVILRLKQLQARIGLGRSAIYYLMDPRSPYFDSQFPRSIKLGKHSIGWVESEVNTWLESRVNENRVPQH